MTSCSNLKDVWEGKRFEVQISLQGIRHGVSSTRIRWGQQGTWRVSSKAHTI